MIDIWLDVGGKQAIKPMMASIFRFVESQEQVATLSLVNNVYEQGVLEELLESTKSHLPDEMDSLHYLLKTPFRYPPLKHGSRFGTIFEQGIFYGSLTISTALAETAYYRFVYMLGPEVPFQAVISSEYSSFSVSVKSESGIFLDEPPFTPYESILTSPTSYTETQRLGSDMRQNGVEMFRYISARDKHKGRNVALFTPKAFHSNKPSKLTTWLCQTTVEAVGFFSKENDERIMYMQKDFWVDGEFPSPAV
ncbi:RES family NAD+ phosphorylase [Legionella oakridgensis]|uniref:RES domain protein n=2 Tax=Legionella oakridgensis TaxID=29423 RepID=W0BA95_9GAMM|nr:RES family NAD+ phosphorylase [Legionella oakridgensis]AHE66755.1 RES domain protein [Legionella oakridgensis ATCC 33761 = DSM 21215]ETO93544.1 RES domain protein [Legionella oakridgensis RV-2-2007]KTD39840.1 RES domain protein [Legionella oakridgensis]STY19880.1 RES domain [Legionella longbeachae]